MLLNRGTLKDIIALSLLLLLFVHTASAQLNVPPQDLDQFANIAFYPATVTVGGSVQITLTLYENGRNGVEPPWGYSAYNSNVFIVFEPPSNTLVQEGDFNLNPYYIPTCSASLPLTDACVMTPNVVWSGDSLPTLTVQSQSWLPSGDYYYLGYVDSGDISCAPSEPPYPQCCGPGLSSCSISVPGCSADSPEYLPSSTSAHCTAYPGPPYACYTGGGDQQGTCNEQPDFTYAYNTLDVVPQAVPTVTLGQGPSPNTNAKKPFEILPGASAYVNASFSGLACDDESLVELSASGQQCVNQNTLASSPAGQSSTYVYCNEDTTPDSSLFSYPGSGTAWPWPPCLFDVAEVFNTSDAMYGAPTPYCTQVYVTNETLPQGNYSICASYQPTEPNGEGGQTVTGSPEDTNNYLNITTNESTGPSYGSYLNFGSPTFYPGSGGGVQVTLNPELSQGSPYLSYYSSIDQQVPSSICPIAPAGNPSGVGCVFEVGKYNPGTGCAPPLYGPTGGSSNIDYLIPQCSTSNPTFPCLLGDLGSSSSASIPGGLLQQGDNYVVCAYSYDTITYPIDSSENIASQPTYYQQNAQRYGWSVPALSIFFASANIICPSSSTTCTTGTSDEQVPTQVVGSIGLPRTALGSIAINPPVLPTGTATSASVTGSAVGIQQAGYDLYFMPYIQTTSFTSLETVCASALSIYAPCTGSGADQAGCVISYLPPATPVTTTVPCTYQETAGPPSGTSCSCGPYLPAGCSYNPSTEVLSCPVPEGTTTTSSTTTTILGSTCTIQTQSLPVPELQNGRYLYCLIYDGGYVSGGILTVQEAPTSPTTINPGLASITPLSQELCKVYTGINGVLLLFALAILILGAIVYEASTILPAQARATLQGYAMGMVIAGIVGAAITGISYFVVSIATNVPVSSLAVCAIPTTTTTTSTTTTIATTSVSTSTIATSSTSSSTTTTTTSIPFYVYDNCESSRSGCHSPASVRFGAYCEGSACSSDGPTVILDYGGEQCPASQPSPLPASCGPRGSYTAPPPSPCLLAEASAPLAEQSYTVSTGESGATDIICAYTSTSGGPLSAETTLVIGAEEITTTISYTCGIGCGGGTCPVGFKCAPNEETGCPACYPK